MTNFPATITVKRELASALTAFHAHDSCYRDECNLAHAPHVPCDRGHTLAVHIERILEFMNEMDSQTRQSSARAA